MIEIISVMHQPIPKKLSSKISYKNIKPKNLKNKDSLITSARTPRSGQFKIDLKKQNLQKFKTIKSIPTITYRDIESTLFHNQIAENQQNFSYLNHTECRLESDICSMNRNNIKRLLSDRRRQKSISCEKEKQSPFLKLKNDEKTKKKKENNKKQQKSKQRRNTTLNIGNFQPEESNIKSKPKLERILKRTNQLLLRYRTREQMWKKQKQQLIKQIEKYKKKTNGKSITTVNSTHNSQSHKLLIQRLI